MKESQLTKKIVDAIRDEYGSLVWVRKIHGGPHQTAGIPDIIGCLTGTFFGLEVKRPGKEKTLTKLQAHALRGIREAEGVQAVVTSPDEALEALEGIQII